VHRWLELTKLAAVVMVVVLLARMATRLQDVIGLVLLSTAFALLTAPFRRKLTRIVPGGAATALTALATFVFVVSLGALVLRDLQGQADRIADDLTSRIEELEPGSRPARFADVIDAQ
jgi:predicted PurR-regulated permease PerM